MLRVIAGPDEADRLTVPAPAGLTAAATVEVKGLRAGWSPDLGYAAVDPQVASTCLAALAAIAETGCTIEEIASPFADPQDVFNTIIRAENHVFAAPLAERHPDLLDPGMLGFIRDGAGIGADEYLGAIRARGELCEALSGVFERCDVLLTPTLAASPFPIDERPRTIAGRSVTGMDWLSFTYPFNLTGNPAVSVPCGFTPDGLPVGLQIVGPRFADARVLALAAAFEDARPWRGRRPSLEGGVLPS